MGWLSLDVSTVDVKAIGSESLDWVQLDYYYLFLLFGLWGYCDGGDSWPIVPSLGDNENDYGEADGM
jgi:hypothetical protein